MSERLDEERLEVLRKWGVGLSTDGREELRAAGKAIALLVEEIDRLQVEVWHARAATAAAGGAHDTLATSETAPEERASEPERPEELSGTLRDRLGSVLPSLNASNDL